MKRVRDIPSTPAREMLWVTDLEKRQTEIYYQHQCCWYLSMASLVAKCICIRRLFDPRPSVLGTPIFVENCPIGADCKLGWRAFSTEQRVCMCKVGTPGLDGSERPGGRQILARVEESLPLFQQKSALYGKLQSRSSMPPACRAPSAHLPRTYIR